MRICKLLSLTILCVHTYRIDTLFVDSTCFSVQTLVFVYMQIVELVCIKIVVFVYVQICRI